MEQVIKRRIEKELEMHDPLSDKQYGFRQGKSTIDAMMHVKKIAEDCRKKRKKCAILAVDVQNAFNSVPWKGIVEELEKKTPPYLVRTICSYFKNRVLKIDETCTMQLSSGIPQGSKLGPLLWNVYYDPVLRINMPEDTHLIAYADDLLIVVCDKSLQMLEEKSNVAISSVNDWIEQRGLTLAPHKTEVVVLSGRKSICNIQVMVKNTSITAKSSTKYLGVIFDQNMRLTSHITYAVEKAEKVAAALGRLMPNIGGPGNGKRHILASVVYSTLFYGAPIWQTALKWEKYRAMYEKVQRKMMLRIARAYRTTSTVALQVISDSPPIELLVEERCKKHLIGRTETGEQQRLREEVLEAWQIRWEQERGKGDWTRRLIKDVRTWSTRKHGEVNHWLTQMLSGHGIFQQYKYRFKLCSSSQCFYCDGTDDVEHTFFICNRWDRQRLELNGKLNTTVNVENLVEIMLVNPASWGYVDKFVTSILKQKQVDEQRLEPERCRNN
ncbi:hypothetical protein M8J77_013857 [Diaphorina citri]|nr:hypothetical protein M8J77_013857 [Diaphorina citri]